MKPFLDALAEGPLLFDGAIGSLLYDRGVFLTRSYDELNVSQPELIRQVHREYLDAGAQVLETNTFGANRLALAKHGHSASAEAINRAAVGIAREVAGQKAWTAGALGPTGVPFAIATARERDMAVEALIEQVGWLVEGGVDLLILETFYSIVELECAIVAAKKAANLPIVAQLVFDATGVAEGGLEPAVVARRLVEAGADVVGANCGVGPPELYQVASQMVGCGAPVSVQPNAGLPSRIEGRTIYVANPEHFGVFARRMLKSGVSIIGGCCGTTPEHTRSMLGAVRMMRGGSEPTRSRTVVSAPATAPRARPEALVPLAQRSRLGGRIARGEFAVSIELNAPRGSSTTQLLQHIRVAAGGGADIINIADGPRATSRMSNLAMCAVARRDSGVEPILHVCCRDRNYLGLVGHLLGAHALGLRNLVIITGDPPKMGDFPFATPVYDVDSVGSLGDCRRPQQRHRSGGQRARWAHLVRPGHRCRAGRLGLRARAAAYRSQKSRRRRATHDPASL